MNASTLLVTAFAAMSMAIPFFPWKAPGGDLPPTIASSDLE